MAATLKIVNGEVINEGETRQLDILIKNGRIEKIAAEISDDAERVIDAAGLLVLPGIIDDQVHFRDPGVTYKGDIFTESRAAVAGGITTFMDMPNTKPNTLTQEALAAKYILGREKAVANYSFYMGASNDNIEELLKTDAQNVCGIKVFMGSSTGNMLVDNQQTLERIFSECDILIATHCEDEATIRANTEAAREKYGEDVPLEQHPLIRSREACLKSSSFAVDLAKRNDGRLHVLHLTTADEMQLFNSQLPLEQKRITAEVCVHHLTFSDEDYKERGTHIKWNPAIKKASDREALWQALTADVIDVIATDHAPHTIEEKDNSYFKAPAGGPLVQHALVAMLEHAKAGKISVERVVHKMCHAPAICYQIKERGFLREGYFADITLVDPQSSWVVNKDNILYKCQWSPFEGDRFQHAVKYTVINGNIVYDNGQIDEGHRGMRLEFVR